MPFGTKGLQILAQYLDLLAEKLWGGTEADDFTSAPETSRQIINKWISDQTEGLIKDLIPAGAIDSLQGCTH